MKPIWNWLKDDKNRDVIKMTGAGLAALAAAGWAVLTFVVDRSPPPSVTAGAGGVAAGRDMSGNTINVGTPSGPVTPPVAKPR